MGKFGRHTHRVARSFAALMAAAAMTATFVVATTLPAQATIAGSVTLVDISTNFNSPIGVDYYEPTNQVVLSVNYAGGGQPNNFDIVAADGTHTAFSSVAGLTDEVYMAAIRTSSCEGGFTPGDMFFGTGNAGEIDRLSSNGTVLTAPWVTLPGEPGLLRGGLFQDIFCTFNGDLIVTTTAENVWRVTSAGVATEVATGVGDTLEGPTTVPNDAARYGPWAGKIVVASEGAGTVEAIAADGTVATFSGFPSAEAVHVVPANQNFFGVDFADGKLVGAPASQFSGVVGDVVVATEVPGGLLDAKWNGTTFDTVDLLSADVSQFEGTAFAPAGISQVPPVPTGSNTPPSLTVPGAQSVQYSDPLSFNVSATDPDAGDTIALGASGLPAGLTFKDNGGGSGSVTGTVTAVPNDYVATFSASDGVNSPVTKQVTIHVLREDCTLTSPPTILSSASGPTQLTTTMGELDSSLGDRSNKSVSFTAVDASNNQSGPFTGLTDGSGVASASAPLAEGVYTVSAAFAGDTFYNPCTTSTPSIVTVSPATAKVTGGGWISNSTGRVSFGFNAIPDVTGLHGQIQIRTANKSNFHGDVVLTLSGTGSSAQWTGTGTWNGQPNYRFTASVVDNSNGKGDSISLTVLPPTGNTPVWSTNGSQTLKGGNITVH